MSFHVDRSFSVIARWPSSTSPLQQNWPVLYNVLEASQSGHGFLQERGMRFENPPDYNNYFASLRSQRRGDLGVK
jgi:hypothetical protein